ncbi:MAG TPA: winged helix-turn-helix transcriptional regulator [Vicinamibacteria bacterium]|nr:winged helix-turn-helix transcriptional regulator [Vicinamibacteria bacterium]
MWRYRQYCPVARAAEIFADRWTPLIVRELLAGTSHFNQLQRGLPGISRTLLSTRLQSLEDAAVVVRRVGARPQSTEYRLTPAGEELAAVVESLGAWGARWAFGDPRPDELDPVLLLWKMRRRIHRARLPPGRVVVEFEFAGRRPPRLWLVLKREEASVCLKPPGFDSDLVVKADLSAFYQVWLGRLPLANALRSGQVRLEGPSALVRDFPRWLKWSPMFEHVRAAAAR